MQRHRHEQLNGGEQQHEQRHDEAEAAVDSRDEAHASPAPVSVQVAIARELNDAAEERKFTHRPLHSLRCTEVNSQLQDSVDLKVERSLERPCDEDTERPNQHHREHEDCGCHSHCAALLALPLDGEALAQRELWRISGHQPSSIVLILWALVPQRLSVQG